MELGVVPIAIQLFSSDLSRMAAIQLVKNLSQHSGHFILIAPLFLSDDFGRRILLMGAGNAILELMEKDESNTNMAYLNEIYDDCADYLRSLWLNGPLLAPGPFLNLTSA